MITFLNFSFKRSIRSYSKSIKTGHNTALFTFNFLGVYPFINLKFFHSSIPSFRINLTKEQKDAIIFPDEIKEFITGMQLGDSCIHMNGKDARISFRQDNLELVKHYYEKSNRDNRKRSYSFTC
jgi:hypothetical protein